MTALDRRIREQHNDPPLSHDANTYLKLDLLSPRAQRKEERISSASSHPYALISLDATRQLYCTLLRVRFLIDNAATPEIAH